MVKQQRLVNQTLKEEIQGIHGLQVRPTFLVYIIAVAHYSFVLVENYCTFVDRGPAADYSVFIQCDIVCTTSPPYGHPRDFKHVPLLNKE